MNYEAEKGIFNDIIKSLIESSLLRDNRGEVRAMLLTEYDEQAHIEYEKEISYEEGKAEGREGLSKLVQLLLSAGRVEDVDKATKDKVYCNQLMREFNIE